MIRPLTLLLTLMLLGLQGRIWVSDGGVAHTHRVSAQLEAEREHVKKMQARNAALEAEVRDLTSGVEAIEARARSMLGMIKNGETFYLVVAK